MLWKSRVTLIAHWCCVECWYYLWFSFFFSPHNTLYSR